MPSVGLSVCFCVSLFLLRYIEREGSLRQKEVITWQKVKSTKTKEIHEAI